MVSFIFSFGGVGFGFELGSAVRSARNAGSHTPLEDRRVYSSDEECGYLRRRRIPVLSSDPCGRDFLLESRALDLDIRAFCSFFEKTPSRIFTN